MGETMNQLSGGNGATGNAGEMLNLTGRARSLANLRPFAPGHPPTAGAGRPKKDHRLLRELSRALRDLVPNDPQGRNFYRLVVQALVKQAAKGNTDAMKIILDRQVGRVCDVDEPERPTSIVVNVLRNQPRDFADRDRDNDDTR
jgi:hypothetical protein